MSKLKNDAQCDAKDGGCDPVKQQHVPDAVKEEGNDKRQNVKQDFPAKQDPEIHSLRPRKTMTADASAYQGLEVIHEMPFQRKKPIESPEIELLKSVHPEVGLFGRQSGQSSSVEIIV